MSKFWHGSLGIAISTAVAIASGTSVGCGSDDDGGVQNAGGVGGTSNASGSGGNPPTCEPDEKLCVNPLSTGGEMSCVSLDDPLYGCAAESCAQCPFLDLNTSDISCSSEGRCIAICDAGFGDCDSDHQTCETDVATPENCGECGHVCEGEHVNENGCSDGECTIVSCEDGYFDQDDDPENGCESQDPCPFDPPSNLSACDTYNAICAYEEQDVCALCGSVSWEVKALDTAPCWDRPSSCPMWDEPHPRYCSAGNDGAVCCYTFNGEPRGYMTCNGEYWVKEPMTYYENHCP